jgi:secreted trypsin-like serine protease
MSAKKLIRNPLWATLLAALVAAMVSFFVFVEGGAAAQGADQNTYEPYIINGEPVPNGKYPFIAALTSSTWRGGKPNPSPNDLFCGGSLIDKDSVLTAGHCVAPELIAPQDEKNVRVVLGRTVLSSNHGQVRDVEKIFRNPAYAVVGGSLVRDVAVLELDRAVKGIKPIKLATTDQNYLERPGRDAIIAGWGSTTQRPACGKGPEPQLPDRMREARVPIISDSKAEEAYQQLPQCAGIGPFVPKVMIAAGGTDVDTCQGDSGGPLFVRTSGNDDNGRNGDDENGNDDNAKNGGKYIQIGIVSFGPGCAADYPGAYTEVNAKPIASFIERTADNGDGDGNDDN